MGIVTPQGVLDVSEAGRALGYREGQLPSSVMGAIEGGEASVAALRELTGRARLHSGRSAWLRDESALNVLPCVARPSKILCVGLNYRKHAETLRGPRRLERLRHGGGHAGAAAGARAYGPREGRAVPWAFSRLLRRDLHFFSFRRYEASGDGPVRFRSSRNRRQSENSLKDVLLLPWNDAEALERVLRERKDEIAAVITEPIMCNNGCIRPKPGYLERMREWT